MQEDYSAQVDAAIPEQTNLAKGGNLAQAVENLLSLEKLARQGEDSSSTTKVAVAIVRLCYEAGDIRFLNQNLQLLAKRRGQLRTVIQQFIGEAMKYLDDPKLSAADRMELLENLRTITEGKIFVEVERARLTRILASIREKEGKIGEAADILQEIQVETFGQMDKVEKTAFILEQMRLCIEKKDFIKAMILANKVSKKMLTDKEMEEIKLQYYELLIRIYLHDKKYLDIAKSYHAVYETPIVKQSEEKWKSALQLLVLWTVMSPYDNEQSDMAHRIQQDKNLEKIPLYKKLLDDFLTLELMRWSNVEIEFAPQLRSAHQNLFKDNSMTIDGPVNLWDIFRSRIVEHNIRVIEKYYTRVTLDRLSQLLDLTPSESEDFVSRMVTSKSIFAKIDRPSKIISFRKRKEVNDVLNDWSQGVNGLLNLLESTCHAVHREMMVHKVN
eukprot:TRINITY_DN1185_c0_g1_i2.p1 TRINITY_DN1185_c0_g1~~TRINITY_DN1185_c0_g1_i2.p1  ORF type:complete len:442 (-),score=144.40 TRINITY_DN1185_c0_g1_i2:77-1402(-)